jgi:hypothetical protein
MRLTIGLWLEHPVVQIPWFGLTPCPLVIFTFGCLLIARLPIHWWLLAIPVIWSLIGGSAAFLLQVPQDTVLLASGALTLALLWRTDTYAAHG